MAYDRQAAILTPIMEPELSPQRIAALLAWYREMGVNAVLEADPLDWRAKGNVAPGAGFAMPERADPATVPRPSSTAIAARAARPNAAPAPRASPAIRTFAPPAMPTPSSSGSASPLAARTLAELHAALSAFEGCGLKTTAKNLCLYRGADTAPLMIIGEAPGREEDLAGKPFVGPAGQLLDKMLAAIGLTEAGVHITNVVYWRPPGNRTPSPQEMLACAPFLARQIELVAPRVILLLGGAAAKQMLATDDGIMKLRGKWREIACGEIKIATMATLHPAYVLRAPASKRQVWRDLRAIREAL